LPGEVDIFEPQSRDLAHAHAGCEKQFHDRPFQRIPSGGNQLFNFLQRQHAPNAFRQLAAADMRHRTVCDQTRESEKPVEQFQCVDASVERCRALSLANHLGLEVLNVGAPGLYRTHWPQAFYESLDREAIIDDGALAEIASCHVASKALDKLTVRVGITANERFRHGPTLSSSSFGSPPAA